MNLDQWSDQDLVEQLLDYGGGLTEWEVQFVESIARQFEGNGRRLTEKQRRVARSIVERLGETCLGDDEEDA